MNKTVRIYIFILIAALGIGTLASCGSSQYNTYKRYVKRKNTNMGYRSNYQKKLKRNTMPINRNYIIRNKRTAPAWR
ncbi:MAG: hypothetical protein JXR53_04015 [Bacteroidales bacterium]|nr:hypothetical protein [Bacteroidales bacterium]